MRNHLPAKNNREYASGLSPHRWRPFEIELALPIYEQLRLLHETFPFGRTLDITAEILFCNWTRHHLPHAGQKSDLLLEKIRKAGYVAQPERRRHPPEKFSIVTVSLGGIPRYVVEHLPHVPSTPTSQNPYYGQAPEQMIAKILEHEISQTIKEYQQRGLIDEDDLS